MRYKILDPIIICKFFLPTTSGSPKTFCQKLLETEVNPMDRVMFDMKTITIAKSVKIFRS